MDNKLVTFDEEKKEITVWIEPDYPYRITLDRIFSSAALLDWVFLISQQHACTGEHIMEFLDCIENLTDKYHNLQAQAVFCYWGQNKENIKWPTC